MGELFYQVSKILVVRGRVSFMAERCSDRANPHYLPLQLATKYVFVVCSSKNGRNTNRHSWES